MPGRFTRLTVPPVEMPDLYRSADVFLHLSRDESFGNVYVEAMACGLPIVAHDIPRVRWIVGDDEHLIDTDQPTQLVSALQEVLDASVGDRCVPAESRGGVRLVRSCREVSGFLFRCDCAPRLSEQAGADGPRWGGCLHLAHREIASFRTFVKRNPLVSHSVGVRGDRLHITLR